uniref:Uncharacterized protein n=1 Tax=viral metagenome TaxID=1070528 RepID=A0A6C0M010_9ZZZZ
MPKFTLRVNPHTRKAYVRKPLTIKVRKPQLKQIVFHPQTPRKIYARKEPFLQMAPSLKTVLRSVPPQFSTEFAVKKIKYVAAIVCHGMSCDSAKHLMCQHLVTCENPLFKTEYDLVFTSKYGDTSESYGNSQLVANYLCKNMTTRNNVRGADFMKILDSTIDRGGTNVGIGGALGKNTILTQKDIGTDVADLKLFMNGTYNDNDNDSIFLFEIGPTNDCVNISDHNLLAVNPDELIIRRPGLLYVAQAAQNLQSFIEPTGAPLVRDSTTGTMLWSDVTHRLKQFKDDPDRDRSIVRLSDILKKKGIFPEGTVVITYVCRSTLVDDLCVETPKRSDYRTVPSTPMGGDQTTTPTTFALLDQTTTPMASGETPTSPFASFAPFDVDWFDDAASHNSNTSLFDWGVWEDDMPNGGAIKKRSKRKKTLKKRRN